MLIHLFFFFKYNFSMFLFHVNVIQAVFCKDAFDKAICIHSFHLFMIAFPIVPFAP